MELILKHCGVDVSGLSVLDFGCAMGQGVEVLAQYASDAEGYDFAAVGIERARKMVPGHNFMSEMPKKVYDVVISSNVLEHLKDPVELFREILKMSRKYVILLMPYSQLPTCEVHPTAITGNTFPVSIDGFKQTRCVIVPNEKPELLGGEQVLFVYERRDNAYFTLDDERNGRIYDFTLPEAWWSRFYEYVWIRRYIKPGETVVDAGSGPNYPLQYVLAETCKVYSIDINQDILNSKPDPNITHMFADIANTGLPDSSIDTVYCVSVIEHLGADGIVATLNEFLRILKPGGRVILTMDIAMTRELMYSWAAKPQDFFDVVPQGFVYDSYENDAPDNAIKEIKHQLHCYHAILRKGGRA